MDIKLRQEKAYLLNILDMIYFHIRELNGGVGESPIVGRKIILDAINEALREIIIYASEYKVNILERDSVKVFSFTIPKLHALLILENVEIDKNLLYLACIRFIEKSNEMDFKNLPDIQNTIRILSEFDSNKSNKYASYAYLKGLQEASICTK